MVTNPLSPYREIVAYFSFPMWYSDKMFFRSSSQMTSLWPTSSSHSLSSKEIPVVVGNSLDASYLDFSY